MKLSNHVLMSRNAPASNLSVTIADRLRQCISPKCDKTFSSDKDQQSFSNVYYRCDYVKFKNTRSYLQHLSLTNLSILLEPSKFVY